MFDSFNSGARRAVSYARYEALARAAGDVDTHHLLLGVLRERDELTLEVLASFGVEPVRFRTMWPATTDPEASDPGVELLFSEDAKTALLHTRTEAEALGAPAVAPLHLLLGVLRVRDGRAATAFSEAGMDYDAVVERSRSFIQELSARTATTEIASIVLRRAHYEFIDRLRQRLSGDQPQRRPSREEVIVALVDGLGSHEKALMEAESLDAVREIVARSAPPREEG
jgi:ATP-dependent Clp protease ATP-binding subunit ClpC